MHTTDLQRSLLNKSRQMINFYTPRGLHVYFKDPLSSNVDFEKVISKVESIIPHHLMGEVEMIVVGQFDEFAERAVNAFYADGMVCITNDQEDENDMIDDIVHEIAHAVEEDEGYYIYGDKKVRNEFISKRETLYDILWSSGHKIPKSVFLDSEYNQELDMFLLQNVGYDKLAQYSQGLFISAYSVTSLREYFATAFTDFFMRPDSHRVIKLLSPQAYKKINNLYSQNT
jgi:hypothetical protein